MAKITEGNKPTQNQDNAQGQTQGGVFGNNESVNVNQAFGFAGDSSRAGVFVREIKEQFERNGNDYGYKVGTVGLNSDYVSVAYVSFMYEQTPVFALALFETSTQSVLNYQDGTRNRYTTVASMIGNEHIQTVTESIKSQCGYSADPVYVTLQVIPRTVELSSEVVRRVAAQMVTSIEARGVRHGQLKTSEHNKVMFNFRDFSEGVVADANRVPQRADWSLDMQTIATDNGQSNKPVLESTQGGHLPAPVVACGYVNLRFVGPQDNPNDFVDQPSKFKTEQLSPEMVISQLDAVSMGIECTYERSIETLGGIAKIAQVGGWKQPLLTSLNGPKRKLSALAQHLYFVPNVEIDFKSFDKEPSVAIDMLCYKTAAVVVKYRKGDGISGLAQLLAEIAYGDVDSLAILMSKLDSLYDRNVAKKFSVAYAEKLGRPLQNTDIVSTAVPVPAGSYSGSNGLRSLDDMDLVDVANRVGDQFDHFKNYVHATSYDNRLHDVEEVMMYQMNLAKEFYGPNDLRLFGDALDMVINPDFLALLIAYQTNCVLAEYNGVIEYAPRDQGLFIGGKQFTVAGVNAPQTQSSFGSFGVTSKLKF